MYERFLNNNDYLGIITKEAMGQLIRGNEERISQAEEASEASIIEYLTDNYQIEKELKRGKQILPYNRQITYPAGTHFYYDGKIYEAIRSISSIKRPSDQLYWEMIVEYDESIRKLAKKYSQLKNWHPGEIVFFNDNLFECKTLHGVDFNDIRIPGADCWELQEGIEDWQPNMPYDINAVVRYDNNYYLLLSLDKINETISPEDSDNWGLIGEYDSDYHYTLSDTEYVVYKGNVYLPIINPDSDKLEVGYNIKEHDPRNPNIKKHMVRLSLYELHKLISPNNVSSARIADYEASITWLRDANRCKINPQIPRKLDEEHKPVAEYAIATFMKDYDPYKNPWQI